MPSVLTVPEIAAYLRIDEQTVYRLLRTRQLRGIKAGREWRVHRDILEQYVRGETDFSHLLTLEQAAAYMSDPRYGTEEHRPSDVARYIVSGSLPARMVKGQWLLAREDLDDYISPADQAALDEADREWKSGESIPLGKVREQLRRGKD